jgi:hypothetical protein
MMKAEVEYRLKAMTIAYSGILLHIGTIRTPILHLL